MSKTKDVYVIEVKTKPPLSALYPSERRYSASTVGGLSMVHFGLGVLALILGVLSRSLQGAVLALACLVPFASGLLAWRRWYIDKNISFFFYGSLVSFSVSILCLVATTFDIAAMAEYGLSTTWRLEHLFPYPEQIRKQDVVGILENDAFERDLVLGGFYNGEKFGNDVPKVTDGRPPEINESSRVRTMTKEKDTNGSETVRESVVDGGIGDNSSPIEKRGPIEGGSTVPPTNGFFSFLRIDPSYTTRTTLLLDINVLVTCLLEMSWSVLSLRISLRGMRNRLVEPSYQNQTSPTRVEGSEQPNVKLRASRPDLVSCDGMYDESSRNSHYLSIMDNSGPRLPLPESKKEFRERVERFLANQAAHRIVEGSCS